MENLVFCGGGSKVFALIGALKFLDSKGYLKSFFRCAGSSAGGLVAGLWGVGASISQIEQIIVEQDLSEFSKDIFNSNLLENSMRLLTDYGYYDSALVSDFMYEIYETKLGVPGRITFKEAYEKTGREIVLTGTNLNRGKTAYFSHRTSPKMEIREAVRITACLPLYFSSVDYKGDIYIDGGMLCNYPIHVFDTVDPEFKKTLTIRFISEYQKNGYYPINNFFDFLDSMVGCFIEQSSKSHIKDEKYTKYSILIDTGTHCARQLDIPLETKHKLMKTGEIEARKWLKTHEHLFEGCAKRSSQRYSGYMGNHNEKDQNSERLESDMDSSMRSTQDPDMDSQRVVADNPVDSIVQNPQTG